MEKNVMHHHSQAFICICMFIFMFISIGGIERSLCWPKNGCMFGRFWKQIINYAFQLGIFNDYDLNYMTSKFKKIESKEKRKLLFIFPFKILAIGIYIYIYETFNINTLLFIRFWRFFLIINDTFVEFHSDITVSDDMIAFSTNKNLFFTYMLSINKSFTVNFARSVSFQPFFVWKMVWDDKYLLDRSVKQLIYVLNVVLTNRTGNIKQCI